VGRAAAFADTVTSTVDYRDSNQTALKKIRDDHFVSKLGRKRSEPYSRLAIAK
jgi:hypothetical protein